MVEKQPLVLGAGKHLLRDACAGPLGQLFPAFCQRRGALAPVPPFFTFLCGGHTPISQDAEHCPLPAAISPFGTLSLCPDSSGDCICDHLSSQLLALSCFHAFHFKEISCQVPCSELSWCFLLSRPLLSLSLPTLFTCFLPAYRQDKHTQTYRKKWK